MCTTLFEVNERFQTTRFLENYDGKRIMKNHKNSFIYAIDIEFNEVMNI